MDDFRRLLAQLGDRLRHWFQQGTRTLQAGSRRAAEALAERRRRQRERAATGDAGASPGDTSRGIEQDAAVVVATRDDDVASVVGRIDVADAPEVILIVRRDARALRRATAWPHIAAHARRRGIVVGVVSPRGDVRGHAQANGLPASRTPGGLRPRREYLQVFGRRWVVPPVPWGRIVRGAMLLVALGTLFFLGCYRVPSATVTLLPPTEPLTVTGEARANALVSVNDVTTQTILATTIRRQLFTAVTTATTGEVEVGDTRAILEVTFENAAATVTQVPRGTRLLTAEGIAFLTDEDLDVPAEGTASVSATAELPGEAGNVEAGALEQVEGAVPATITIAGSTAGSGGENRLTAGVSQEDVDRVREIAGEVLEGIALRTLQQLVEEEGSGTLLPDSVSAAVFSEQPQQLLEEPSEIFVVDYEVTASGLVVTDADAAAYGELLIREALPPGVALVPGSVTATVTPAGDRGQVRIDATGRVATLADISGTAGEITGMRPEAARAFLQRELGLSEPPAIEIVPNFVPWLWLPRRAESIEVVIGTPEAEEDADGDATPTADATTTATATSTPAAAGG